MNSDRLITQISSLLEVPQKQLCLTTDLKEDLDLDWIDFNMLIFYLEDAFERSIAENKMDNLHTIYDLWQAFMNTPKQNLQPIRLSA